MAEVYNLIKPTIWLIVNVIISFAYFYFLKERVGANIGISISIGISVLFAALTYVHPLPLLYLAWKHSLPKETLTKYIMKFGLPYDVGKDTVTWKNMAGFDKTWILDEQIAHTLPVTHIDFVYSTIKVPGIKPEHVCTIAHSTGSIFIDLLKQEATARCHYLVKNAVSLGFVQDVVSGKISKDNARDEYARRILNNVHPDWFPDPLGEAHTTLGEGAHHLLLTGGKHEHFM